MGIQSSIENRSEDFKLGSWTVEPLLNRLSNGSRVIALEPKVMRLLVCLAANEGQVLTREVLLEQVWDNLAVVDSAMGRAVCQLRKRLALADGCQADVETIRQVGFRMVFRTEAPITKARATPLHLSASPAAAWSSAAVATALAAFLMVNELSERGALQTLDNPASASIATTPTEAAKSGEGPSTNVPAPKASGAVVQTPRGSSLAGSPDMLSGRAPRRGNLRSERSRHARAERMAERLANQRQAAEFRRLERETSGLSSAGSRAAPAAPPPPPAPAAPVPDPAPPPPLPERSLS